MESSFGSVNLLNSPSSESLARAYQIIANSLSRQAGCEISVTFTNGNSEIELESKL